MERAASFRQTSGETRREIAELRLCRSPDDAIGSGADAPTEGSILATGMCTLILSKLRRGHASILFTPLAHTTRLFAGMTATCSQICAEIVSIEAPAVRP